MSRKIINLILMMLGLATTSLLANDTLKLARWELNLGFRSDVPTLQYATDMDAIGTGIGASFLYNLDKGGIFNIGFQTGFITYEKDNVTIVEEIDGELVESELYAESNLFQIGGFFRFMPELDYVIWPFIEVETGGLFYVLNTDDGIDSDDSSSIYVGINGGAQYAFPSSRFHAQLKIGYSLSPPVNYYSLNSETNSQDPIENFDIKRSSATSLWIELGIGTVF